MTRTPLQGWGRTRPTVSEVVQAEPARLAAQLADTSDRGVLARGLGRSYGDAAQNGGGRVLLPSASNIWIDPEQSTATVSGGTSLEEVMLAALDHRHFVAVTPGTRQVTVAGAIACDVHGKNHHAMGSFGDHVLGFDLVLADGETRWVDRDSDRELFDATVGGMGLTGVITRAVLRLIPVASGWIAARHRQIRDLDTLMEEMVLADRTATYSVAWIDTLARGRSMGRSVLSTGEHATAEQLEGKARRKPFPGWGPSRLKAPRVAPSQLVSPLNIRAFNEMWFRKAGLGEESGLESIPAFFHPLDGIEGWNRLYGARGFVQYQFVMPDGSEAALTRALETISSAGQPSFLSVLKRFGPGNTSPLSFPFQGWTLAMDVPVSAELPELFARLDDEVTATGGRLYLAKDSRMSPEMVRAGYPELDRFLAVRDRVDPDRRFQSDLSRRLRL